LFRLICGCGRTRLKPILSQPDSIRRAFPHLLWRFSPVTEHGIIGQAWVAFAVAATKVRMERRWVAIAGAVPGVKTGRSRLGKETRSQAATWYLSPMN